MRVRGATTIADDARDDEEPMTMNDANPPQRVRPGADGTTDAVVDAVVHALVRARRDGTPVCARVADSLRDADDAYAVQDRVAQALGWFADGAPRWWKSGGASRESVQTHAPLPPAGVWASPVSRERCAAAARDGTCVPRLRGIEAEIALRLGRDVDAQVAARLDPDGARALVDAMAVTIEIVESRWSEALDAGALAKLADLQSHGALVVGAWQPFDAGRDWSAQVCRVTLGDAPVLEFRGTHSMRDPAWVLPAWLRHATRHGAVLRAGTVVTTGTWCGLSLAKAGDLVRAEFPGIGEAVVALDHGSSGGQRCAHGAAAS